MFSTLLRWIDLRGHRSILAMAVVVFVSLTPAGAWAQGATSGYPDLATMFSSFGVQARTLINVVVGIGFLCGLFIGGLSLMRLKEYAEGQGRVKLSTPLILLAVGASLCALPGTIDMATETLSLGTNTGTQLLGTPPDMGGVPGTGIALAGVLLFVKLVGHIAFIRGLLILKGLGEGQQGRAGLGGALIHIAGGAMCININAWLGILGATFGFDLSALSA